MDATRRGMSGDAVNVDTVPAAVAATARVARLAGAAGRGGTGRQDAMVTGDMTDLVLMTIWWGCFDGQTDNGCLMREVLIDENTQAFNALLPDMFRNEISRCQTFRTG